MPTVDPIPLPGPVPLFLFLLLLTFSLHLIVMNLVLGGGIIALVSEAAGRGWKGDNHRRLFRHLMRLLPLAVSFTITFGVAPLLFLQVLYGPAFYTSSVLMAWPWLSVIAFLMLAYYSVYFVALKGEKRPNCAFAAAAAAVALFALIAFLYTSNSVLMLTPGKWQAMFEADQLGRSLRFGDGTVIPRWLHMLTGAIAIGGLWVMALGLFVRKSSDKDYRRFLLRCGAQWFAHGTVANILTGVWLLLALPKAAMMAMMGQSLWQTAFLAAGSALGLLAMVLALLSLASKRPERLVIVTAVCALVAIVAMVLLRHGVRQSYLRPHLDIATLPVQSQTPIVVLFFALLLAGVGVIAWMLWQVKVAKGSPRAAEAS